MLFFNRGDINLSETIIFDPFLHTYNQHESLHQALLKASTDYQKMSAVDKMISCANVTNLLYTKANGGSFYCGVLHPPNQNRVKIPHLLKIYPNIKKAVLLNPARESLNTIDIGEYLHKYKGRQLSTRLIALIKNNGMVNEADKVTTLFSKSRCIKK
jgi:hypothetical protein